MRAFLCMSRGCICAVVTPDGAPPQRPCEGCGWLNWEPWRKMTYGEWAAFCAARWAELAEDASGVDP